MANKVSDSVAVPGKQSRNERIEEFLREHYAFRYNTVKSRAEFRSSDGEFLPVTKYRLNSFRRELDRTIGISTSAENLRSMLESDFSERVNPVQAYFHKLPPATGTQAIDELTATVTVRNARHWSEYLTKWLVGVVANAMNDLGCQNHVCLVLTGEQGKFKTTWLDNLCPRSLASYLFTGKIDPQNKDMLTLVAEYLFINIDDQLKTLNKRDENELKNLITAPSVKYRRPYDVYIEEYPHLASFMASVNGNDFLTDPTGSRCFLPFEVLSIDIDRAIWVNMDRVYAEARTLLNDGFRYWFDEAEIEELHRGNAAFHVQTRIRNAAERVREASGTCRRRLLYDHRGDSELPAQLFVAEPLRETYGRSLAQGRVRTTLETCQRKSRLRLGHREDHTQSFRLLRIVVTTLLHTAAKH